ncbi:hypothetical protein ACWGI8_31955 [Streptomyces sp. NPDC054841]
MTPIVGAGSGTPVSFTSSSSWPVQQPPPPGDTECQGLGGGAEDAPTLGRRLRVLGIAIGCGGAYSGVLQVHWVDANAVPEAFVDTTASTLRHYLNNGALPGRLADAMSA